MSKKMRSYQRHRARFWGRIVFRDTCKCEEEALWHAKVRATPQQTGRKKEKGMIKSRGRGEGIDCELGKWFRSIWKGKGPYEELEKVEGKDYLPEPRLGGKIPGFVTRQADIIS